MKSPALLHSNPKIDPADRRRVLMKRIRGLERRGVGIAAVTRPKLLKKLADYENELRFYPPDQGPTHPQKGRA